MIAPLLETTAPLPEITAPLLERPRLAGGLVGNEFLAGTLSRHDHCMAALPDAREQVLEQPVRAIKREGHLRNEDGVGIRHGERGRAGDEARVAAHQLHKAHAIRRRFRLHVG